jgi:hypothetical protein
MASVGHIITLLSIVFFCLGLFDSLLLNKVFTPDFYHISRTNKRVLYYLFKINYIKYNNITVTKTSLPQNTCTEFDHFK